MEDLTKNSGCQLMAGNKKVFIADVDEVQSIETKNFANHIITLKENARFAQIFAESIEADCQFSDGCFNHLVTCRFYGYRSRYDQLFTRMVSRRWIVKFVDNNFDIWLSGSKEHPLNFSWRHLSQPKADGEHLYELTFSAKSTEPLLATD